MKSAEDRITDFHKELQALCAEHKVRVDARLEFSTVGDDLDITSIHPTIFISDDSASFDKSLQN